MPLNILNATRENKAPDFPPGVLPQPSWPVSILGRSSPSTHGPPRLPVHSSRSPRGLSLPQPPSGRSSVLQPCSVHTEHARLHIRPSPPMLCHLRRESTHCPSSPGPAAGEGPAWEAEGSGEIHGRDRDNRGHLQHGERLPGEQGRMDTLVNWRR